MAIPAYAGASGWREPPTGRRYCAVRERTMRRPIGAAGGGGPDDEVATALHRGRGGGDEVPAEGGHKGRG